MQSAQSNFVISDSKLGTDSVLTTKFATITVILIFVCSLCSLVIVYASFPNLTE